MTEKSDVERRLRRLLGRLRVTRLSVPSLSRVLRAKIKLFASICRRGRAVLSQLLPRVREGCAHTASSELLDSKAEGRRQKYQWELME